MGKEILTFRDIALGKNKFYRCESYKFFGDVDITN